MHWIAHVVREFLVRWGYLALVAGLMGENAGLPLPGETVLMYSSFLARKSDGMSLMFVIIVGVTAAIVGDNLGFLIGKHFGPRLLNWLKRHLHLDTHIAAATDQIHRHGGATIFWARFIFGLRTVAGPVAGALGMRWKRFALFNALGAVCWVLAISLTSYALATQFHSLADYIEKVSWGLSAALFGAGYYVWHREKKRVEQQP